MATVCTLGGVNLNTGALFVMRQGFDPGEPALTYDEFPSWDGSVVQRNVSRAKIAVASLPIDVRATPGDEATLWGGIDAINVAIRSCTNDAPKALVVGGRTFYVVASPEVRPVYDELWYAGIARLDLALNRKP